MVILEWGMAPPSRKAPCYYKKYNLMSIDLSSYLPSFLSYLKKNPKYRFSQDILGGQVWELKLDLVM